MVLAFRWVDNGRSRLLAGDQNHAQLAPATRGTVVASSMAVKHPHQTLEWSESINRRVIIDVLMSGGGKGRKLT